MGQDGSQVSRRSNSQRNSLNMDDAPIQNSTVIQLPQLSDIDKQFMTLERQQRLIRDQAELIKELVSDGTD